MVLRDLQLDDLSDLANSDNWDLKTSLTRVVTARVKCYDLGSCIYVELMCVVSVRSQGQAQVLGNRATRTVERLLMDIS